MALRTLRQVINASRIEELKKRGTLTINPNDNLKLSLVSGDTGIYSYYKTSAGTELYGSYWQGFFKLEGYPYQVMPQYTSYGWSFETILKPFDIEPLTARTASNNEIYISNLTGVTDSITSFSWQGFQRDDLTASDPFVFINEIEDQSIITPMYNRQLNNSGFIFYLGVRAEDKFNNFFQPEENFLTSEGNVMTGAISGGSYPTITGGTPPSIISAITSTTAGSDWLINGVRPEAYNRISGLTYNAFGLRITPEGAIGYRSVTGVSSCTDFYEVPVIAEEYSLSGHVLPTSSFTHIAAVFKRDEIPQLSDENLFSGCTNNRVNNVGTLRIYVNGMLVLCVYPFYDLMLKALEGVDKEKQIGVPFTISIGGGTQGLFESFTVNGPDVEDQRLLLERWFNGSFTGNIAYANFRGCPIGVDVIRGNIEKFSEKYNIPTVKGGRIISKPSNFIY